VSTTWHAINCSWKCNGQLDRVRDDGWSGRMRRNGVLSATLRHVIRAVQWAYAKLRTVNLIRNANYEDATPNEMAP